MQAKATKSGNERRKPGFVDGEQRREDWKLRRAGELKVLQAIPLTRIEWLVHGFSTRAGGASELKGTEQVRQQRTARVLNLGFTDWDSGERVLENRRRFGEVLGAAKMRVAALRQIHSDVIHVAHARMTRTQAPQGDALITQERGVLLLIQTADCVPILLADIKNRAVGAIHAGWRGTLRRIAEKTLGRMRLEFGTRPEDVSAAVGPCIGRCCYEVGSDVAREFAGQFPKAREWFEGPFDALAAADNDPNWLPWLTMRPPGHPPPSPKVQLDLVAANRSILSDAGVPSERIFCSNLCTACRTDLFFSYRREQITGRMGAAIAIC